jgi:hypothetical protein
MDGKYEVLIWPAPPAVLLALEPPDPPAVESPPALAPTFALGGVLGASALAEHPARAKRPKQTVVGKDLAIMRTVLRYS